MASETESRQEIVGFSSSVIKCTELKKRVLHRLSKGEYEQLKSDLQSYELVGERLSQFFLQEGEEILKWSLIKAINAKPLNFLVESIPKITLLTVLSQKGFKILKSFLRAQVKLERLGWYDQEIEEVQVAKFKVLLAVNNKLITLFMEKVPGTYKKLYTETLMANFAAALEQVADSNF
jgi:hypothetical protein